MIELPQITETHTSDLTRPCARSVLLRHQGLIDAETTGAMFGGLVFGEACAMVHAQAKWFSPAAADFVADAIKVVVAKCNAEKQPLSRATVDGIDDTAKEVTPLVEQYIERFSPYFKGCKLIGVEVPIRATLDVDGEPVDFASHLDLLYRDHTGCLTVWDWKLRTDPDKDPSPEYLARNMQFGMYAVAVERGEVLIGGEWIAMEERPTVSWIDGASLKVYKKKTTLRDGTVMNAGDQKPLARIVREVIVRNPEAVIEQFAVRVRMMRAGLWPTNPDPVGCRICASRRWCPSFDRPRADE